MKKISFSMLFVLFALVASGQTIEVVKFPRLRQVINAPGDEIRVVNFWATWCKPCVEELGYFEALPGQLEGREVKVVLVSLDFAEEVDKKVKKFVDKKGLKSQVMLLDETDQHSFIDFVSPEWSGAIPATLIIDAKTGRKSFYERAFKEGALEKALEEFIN